MKYPENDSFDYELHKSFLDKEDCENLLKEFTKFKIARTLDGDIEFDKEYRKSEVAIYETESLLLKRVRKIISEKTNTNIDQQETPISIIKYEIGGEYKPHYDSYGNLKDIPHPESGDRLKTAILYLNSDYYGGETDFPLENIKIKGEVGDLLFWTNLNKNRTLNRRSLHAGLPIISGVKYILVVWIRENNYNMQIEKKLI